MASATPVSQSFLHVSHRARLIGQESELTGDETLPGRTQPPPTHPSAVTIQRTQCCKAEWRTRPRSTNWPAHLSPAGSLPRHPEGLQGKRTYSWTALARRSATTYFRRYLIKAKTARIRTTRIRSHPNPIPNIIPPSIMLPSNPFLRLGYRAAALPSTYRTRQHRGNLPALAAARLTAWP